MNKITVWCLLIALKEVFTVSPPGDVVGKLTVGYQGWFACKGDTSPINNWIHWNARQIPSPGHQTFELWPDVKDYQNTYQTGYANLGNGQPAKLFGSFDDQTVQVHFQWMSTNGIDVAAVQRFGQNLKDPNGKRHMNGIAEKVMRNAEKFNRKFYIMWDISGWSNFVTELVDDYNNNIVNFTKSPAYARQNGRPVVCVWGMGFSDRPGDRNQSLQVINFLKTGGLYVIGGVPKNWRTGQFSKSGFIGVYTAFHMVSPWSVGSFVGIDQAKNEQTILSADQIYCNEHNIDYQPVLYPGFAWSNWKGGARNVIPRLHGDFMWQQFVNLRQVGIKNAYVAMFDEYDEGTAIAKAAETKATTPTNQYFLTLDADGVRVSSDFYLRLVNDGARMMKLATPLQLTHPTKHLFLN